MRIPVLMYHSVGVPDPLWLWNHLTIPWQRFDSQMRWLKREGYRTLTCDEYLECQRDGYAPGNVIMLTFDDGYLDNWVYAAPILEKYGFCGTVFVNPDFVDPVSSNGSGVDPATGCRPQYRDVPFDEQKIHGFLNWNEMRSMERSGVMEIQSHGMTHTWYFSSPKVVDFHHPGDKHVWMDWNDRPDMKWAYLGHEAYHGGWGAPVYAHQKSLSGPRYYPDPSIRKVLMDFCAEQGPEFFRHADWRFRLRKVLQQAQENASEGYYESRNEYLDRVFRELAESRRIIGEKLNKKVDFFCWPGGGNSEEAMEISAELYKVTTLSSCQRHLAGFDRFGCYRMARMGAPSVEIGDGIFYPGGMYSALALREYEGSSTASFFRKAGKAAILLGARLGMVGQQSYDQERGAAHEC